MLCGSFHKYSRSRRLHPDQIHALEQPFLSQLCQEVLLLPIVLKVFEQSFKKTEWINISQVRIEHMRLFALVWMEASGKGRKFARVISSLTEAEDLIHARYFGFKKRTSFLVRLAGNPTKWPIVTNMAPNHFSLRRLCQTFSFAEFIARPLAEECPHKVVVGMPTEVGCCSISSRS